MINFCIKELEDINLGARPIERIFQKEIESTLAEGMLTKNIENNSKICFYREDKKSIYKIED